ncbi:hypothetical protein GCM10022252_79710 [Streptosporangium oxazolinicum]|uniref:Integral membrane protein n=1 Tax=Streptosporangium oxazolinicum TaxID=909287 RepID=A0ABP8BNX7_9ACTN
MRLEGERKGGAGMPPGSEREAGAVMSPEGEREDSAGVPPGGEREAGAGVFPEVGREAGAPVSLLEKRYRYWLRLLPASYRAEREEEMVSVFLEGSPGVSDDDGPRPRWSEVASVAVLAVRVRLGGAGHPVPRFLAWGETVRLVALLGLGLQAFLGALAATGTLRAYGMIGTTEPMIAQIAGPAGSPERLAAILGGLAGALWFAPLAALLAGRPRVARALALLALVLEVPGLIQVFLTALSRLIAFSGLTTFSGLPVFSGLPDFSGLTVFPWSVPVGLLPPLVTVLALWAGFHRDARPERRSLWLLLPPLVSGAALVGMYEAVASPTIAAWVWPWLDLPGLVSVLILGAGVAYACVHAYAPARRTPSWPLALAILALPVLCVRLAGLGYDVGIGFVDETSRVITLAMFGQAALLLAFVVGSAVLGVRTLPGRSGPGA